MLVCIALLLLGFSIMVCYRETVLLHVTLFVMVRSEAFTFFGTTLVEYLASFNLSIELWLKIKMSRVLHTFSSSCGHKSLNHESPKDWYFTNGCVCAIKLKRLRHVSSAQCPSRDWITLKFANVNIVNYFTEGRLG